MTFLLAVMMTKRVVAVVVRIEETTRPVVMFLKQQKGLMICFLELKELKELKHGRPVNAY